MCVRVSEAYGVCVFNLPRTLLDLDGYEPSRTFFAFFCPQNFGESRHLSLLFMQYDVRHLIFQAIGSNQKGGKTLQSTPIKKKHKKHKNE
jgi:hypothetical protein